MTYDEKLAFCKRWYRKEGRQVFPSYLVVNGRLIVDCVCNKRIYASPGYEEFNEHFTEEHILEHMMGVTDD